MAKQTSPKRPYRLYLEEWIAFKSLNQDVMAERMNCSPGTVSKLIAGKMKQNLEWLARFAHALGPDVEVTDLFRHPERPADFD
jgi:plasmid maintenance system antidote protein VapI